jgi:nitrate/TMAO reductase-like tetraheme cytochrome c subunit
VRNKAFVDHLKESPCTDCGLCFPTDAMDFDHVHGVKLANISDLLNGSRQRLLHELQKTELVCANCHRVREMNRRLDQHVEMALLFDDE